MNLSLSKLTLSHVYKSTARIIFYSTNRPTHNDNKKGGRSKSKTFYGGFHDNIGIDRQLQSMRKNDPNLHITKKDLSFDDNDHDGLVLQAHETYDNYEKELDYRRKQMQHNIMKRKYFKEPVEPCFLTVAAKEQLRFLRDSDPKTWTYDKLAESFPITVTGVKKLLKSKPAIHRLEEDIIKHDNKVLHNWKMLKAGNGGPIASTISKKLLAGNFNFEAMNCDTNLPMPTDNWRQKNSLVPTNTNNNNASCVGEFERMVKEYDDLKRVRKNKTEVSVKTKEKCLFKDQQEEEQLQMATLSSKLSERKVQQQATFEQFKNSLKKELTKINKADLNKLEDWMEKLEPKKTNEVNSMPIIDDYVDKGDILDYLAGNVQKFKETPQPDITWDTPRGAQSENEKEAYMYDPQLGYQRPFGRYESNDNVVIPKNERLENGVYQKDDCFYDENGEFLYRVPHLNTSKH